ncbi:hypothetical protein A374_13430 [Fictibacillus macauensis ZFHKF-1]|uniref:N-acetyltransferase domain-containing protein n=1 Tax=Fictibacillus macauensis ZFHKF-1 TaxID=1196324 RepID=I8IYY7_9BACL|nr:GNAT family N-acetyltransferase [Fictibacillus macauensis]EIT84696.1 hypothetical protein A374_13430 [Fictibacillus macauensis ZFHKF-1]
MAIITELSERPQWIEAFSVMKQLRPHLTEALFLNLVEEMHHSGYTMFGLYDHSRLEAVIGFTITTNLYYGKHVWVYDLVTEERSRGKGYGYELLSFVEAFAVHNNCECLALSSGVQRYDTHRFYTKKMNYKEVSKVFKKDFG